MQIIKEKYEIEETLNKRVRNILMFLNLRGKLEEGNIISISKTNLAYIGPHKLRIKDITYLFFNDCNDVYINSLENKISLNELQSFIKSQIN